jgi:PAS domain S-box-containing protein
MIYKEEKILFPMSLETLDERDWARVRKGEEEIGYAWVTPGAEWKPAVALEGLPPAPHYHRPAATIELDTGALTPGQINLLLKNLPADITFVDETDTVRYFSAGAERIFPRSPGVIGRKVQNCHPPDSVHVVNRILDAFRKGERQVAEFWIQSRGRFIQIRYFAVRDDSGQYKGCLEVSQDVSSARHLQGEQRLLDWK